MRHLKTIALNSAFLLSFLVSGCSSYSHIEKNIYAYSTLMNLSFYNASEEVVEHVEEMLKEYDALCDNYKSRDGYFNLYDLNNNERNVAYKIDTKLYEILDYSLKIMDFCGEFFDIRLGKLSELYKTAIEKREVVNADTVAAYLSESRATNIILDEAETTVTLSGSSDIDLGAIAKGYALEQVKDYLHENGVNYFLLNGGSSSYVLGQKPTDEDGYTVQISNISDTIYKYKDVSIGTSSISEQYYREGDIFYTHIVNPTTGSSAPLYYLVSVVGSDSAEEDAFSTAFMNMSVSEIETLASEYHLDVYISSDGSQIDHQILKKTQ